MNNENQAPNQPQIHVVVTRDTKSVGTATILSFIYPGLGQLYAGSIVKGLGMIFASILIIGLAISVGACAGGIGSCAAIPAGVNLSPSYADPENTGAALGLAGVSVLGILGSILFGGVIPFGWWIFNIFDARRTCQKYNEQLLEDASQYTK